MESQTLPLNMPPDLPIDSPRAQAVGPAQQLVQGVISALEALRGAFGHGFLGAADAGDTL
jgi:hypothetical protein